jgi:hypothetical protein
MLLTRRLILPCLVIVAATTGLWWSIPSNSTEWGLLLKAMTTIPTEPIDLAWFMGGWLLLSLSFLVLCYLFRSLLIAVNRLAATYLAICVLLFGALSALQGPARAQGPSFAQLTLSGVGGRHPTTPATWLATAAPTPANPAFVGTQVTFSVSFGAASPNQEAVVFVGHDTGGSRNITQVKINGTIATPGVYTTGNARVGMWYVPNFNNAATVNVVVTWDNTPNWAALLAGQVVTTHPAPSDGQPYNSSAGGDPQTMGTATVVPTNGVGIIGLYSVQGSGQQVPGWDISTQGDQSDTWTGLIAQMVDAHAKTFGSWTPNVSGSIGNGFGFSGTSMVTAAWGP